MSAQKLLLLDANSLINRAFYGLYGRQQLTAPDGTPTGALFAFFNMFLKLLSEENPSHLVAAFDLPAPTFRHEMYDGYKATRKPMPDDLAIQLPILKELLADFGVVCTEKAGYEADDILGTLARLASPRMPVTIVSGDKDTFQLATDNVQILQPVTRSGQTEVEKYDPAAVKERFQVTPLQYITVKALMGDPSDNIPGVRGVGEKTATELVSSLGDLDNIYASLDQLRPAVAKKLAEDKAAAYLSYELATINQAVPLDDDLDNYKLSAPHTEKLQAQFTRLGFKTLLARLDLAGSQAASLPQVQKGELSDFLAALQAEDLAVELDPEGSFYWLDQNDLIRHLDKTAAEEAWDRLCQSDCLVYAFDYKNWRRQASVKGHPARLHDVMVAAYLLSQLDGKPDLARLYQKVTEKILPQPAPDSLADRQQTLADIGREPAKPATNLAAVLEIGRVQKEQIKERSLEYLAWQVEFPLTAILADMEEQGFCLDKAVLEEISHEQDQRLEELQDQIQQLSGKEFNLNSPKQLSEVLFVDLGLKPGKKRTGGSYSTDAAELERLKDDHAIIGLLLEYRQLAKLRTTYIEGLLKLIDPADGRVHTTFNQTVTATGRLSSKEPNLQNIPIRSEEGRRIRQAFVARPGHVLIDADYSQIELRLLAHLAGDEIMLEAFRMGEDIHITTASRIFGLPAEQITGEMRAIAKTMNFSVIYGISDFGLARDLGVSVKQAHQWITEYDSRYPAVRTYFDHLITQAKKLTYVETLFGRRRYLPELKSPNHNIRSFAERAAMNTPIQGTAADLIKIAMVRTQKALQSQGLKAHLILQVHDELIVEAPLAEKDQAALLLKEAMEGAMELQVPLLADLSQGPSWALQEKL